MAIPKKSGERIRRFISDGEIRKKNGAGNRSAEGLSAIAGGLRVVHLPILARAFSMTLASETSFPSRRALSSAASMKA